MFRVKYRIASCRAAFGSPACGLADVDETDRRDSPFGLLRQIRKQRLLLGTGHQATQGQNSH